LSIIGTARYRCMQRLDIKTGKVQGRTAQRHTSEEFIAFVSDLVSRARWAKEIHIVLDNLSAHKTKVVQQFLADHPKVRFHFTPTYSSWLNQVELWFAKIQRDLLARGIFTSVADLAQDKKVHSSLCQGCPTVPLVIR
jgi:transposase